MNNERKYVGRVLNNVLGIVKNDINSKQNPMKEMSADAAYQVCHPEVGIKDDVIPFYYDIDEENHTITLIQHYGYEKDVHIYAKYRINGIMYDTKIASSRDPQGKQIAYYGLFDRNLSDDVKPNLSDPTNYNRYIETITIDEGVDTSGMTNMDSMFSGPDNLTSIIGLEYLDTSNCESMVGMFNGFKGTTLNFSSFDTSKVKNMSTMFMATNITKLDLTSFDMHNVEDLNLLFGLSQNLEEVKVSRNKWIITATADNRQNLFLMCKCSDVTYVD